MGEQTTRYLRGIDQTFKIGVFGAFFLLGIWVLRDILLLGFAAVLLACAIRGASNIFHRKTGVGPSASVLIVFVGGTLLFGLLIWWRGIAIADQATQLADQLTAHAQQLWDNLGTTPLGSLLARQLQVAAESVKAGLTGYVPGVASSVLGIGGSVFVVIATALFLAASPQVYLTGCLRLLPIEWRPRGREVADKVGITLQLWFLGQLADIGLRPLK